MTSSVLDKDIIIARERDGHVIVYRRAGTKPDSNLHYRIRIPNIHNKYERRTTGTPDEVEAIQKARDRYDELRERQRRNVTVFSKTFDNLAEAYLADLEHRLKIGAKGVTQSVYDLAEWTIHSYFLPFWGKKEVDTFTGTDIAAFHKWRMERWDADKDKVRNVSHGMGFKRRFRNASIKRPSAQSQARDEGVFNQIMRYGVVNRWLTLAELPTYDRTKPDKKRRAGFDDDEFARLLNHLEKRIAEAEEGVDKRIIHQRRVIYDYVRFLAYSGLRVGECRFLKFRDIDRYAVDESWMDEEAVSRILISPEEMGLDGTESIEEITAMFGEPEPLTFESLSAGDAPFLPWNGYDGREVVITIPNGKTGIRKVVAQREIIDVRNSIVSYHPDPYPESYVWIDHKGRHLNSFKETFAVLLDELGLRVADSGVHKGARRSLYSLRHYYATQRLRAGVDIYLLAKNMGTSVQQIEHYYSDVLVEREAKRIAISQ